MISYDFFEVNEGDELFELEKLNFGISILSPPFIDSTLPCLDVDLSDDQIAWLNLRT